MPPHASKELADRLHPFATCFTAAVWRHVLVLVAGALLAPGRRTVTAALRVMGIDLVARRRLRGVRLAVDRLDAHPLHQRRDTPAADRDPLLAQEIAQHPAACEGELEMEFVDPPHDREFGRRHRPGRVGDAAAADPERLCLLRDRQVVLAVDHRFALGRPALPSAPSKKSLASVSSPILAWSVLTSTAGAVDAALGSEPNTPAAPSRS